MHTFTLLQLSSVFCRFRFSWGNIWRDVERYEWRWLRNSSWAFVSIKHTSQPTKQSPTIYWSFHSLACFMVNWMISFAYTSKIFHIGCHHWCSSKVFVSFSKFWDTFPNLLQNWQLHLLQYACYRKLRKIALGLRNTWYVRSATDCTALKIAVPFLRVSWLVKNATLFFSQTTHMKNSEHPVGVFSWKQWFCHRVKESCIH